MGAGVAGLQAIATARRLGAIVTATDVRPAAKEQVESLGAKFVAVEDEEFKQAETAAGYAKEMSKDYQAKQAALVAEHIKKQDIVITTALIPGRPAPRLISKDMVASMRPGSVIVDLAVERGGNVEGAKGGEVVAANGVKIVGHLNMAGRIAASASSLYAKNLFAFLEILVDKNAKALAVKWDDEIVKATALTRDGAVIHPSFAPRKVLHQVALRDARGAARGERHADEHSIGGPRGSGQRHRARPARHHRRGVGRRHACRHRRRRSIPSCSGSRSSCWRSSSAITWFGR